MKEMSMQPKDAVGKAVWGTKNVRIIGLGNVLMSDDGFGPYAARVLEAYYEFPENVRIVDAGQPGIDLVPYLANADVVILIDTVRAKGTPGDVHAYAPEEILESDPHSPLCPHDPGISEALVSVSAAGAMPRHLVLLGVIPEWVATGSWLSDSLRAAIEPVIGLTITELDRLGIRAKRRAVPREPDTWWERESDLVRLPR
jgi:hydrogenase maturation protease